MNHEHGCDKAGHMWSCESDDCVCICQVPMERGDHSKCPIELKACPEHSHPAGADINTEQMGRDETGSGDLPGMQARLPNEGWAQLKPLSAEIEDKLEAWFDSEGTLGAFCCLCGTEFGQEDLLPNSNTHDCDAGRALESSIQQARAPDGQIV
jgi:hypothetical protein